MHFEAEYTSSLKYYLLFYKTILERCFLRASSGLKLQNYQNYHVPSAWRLLTSLCLVHGTFCVRACVMRADVQVGKTALLESNNTVDTNSLTNSCHAHTRVINIALVTHCIFLFLTPWYFWGEPHSPHCQKTRFFSFWNQILSFFLVLSPKVHWYYLNRALQSIFRGFFQSVCKKSTDAWFRGRSLRQCQNDLFPTAPKMNL